MAEIKKPITKRYMAAFGALYGDGTALPPRKSKAQKEADSGAPVKPKVPTEQQEQFVLAHWLRLMKIRFFHPANGGSRDIREAAKLKRLGVSPGVPDIVIPIPVDPYHSLYIELKRTKGGSISVEQKEWMAWLNLNGHLAVVCKGADEAIVVVKNYLGLP